MGNFDEILARLARRSAHQRDGRHGDTLVHNGDAVVTFDGITRHHQVFRIGGNLAVNVVAQLIYIIAHTVEQADAHGDGTHIELFLLDHLIGLMDLHNVDHRRIPFIGMTCACEGFAGDLSASPAKP